MGGDIVATLTVDESRRIVLFEEAARRIPDAYGRLRELLETKAFDVLICYDTTRLGRKRSLIMTVLELCGEAGVTVYEIDNPPADLDALQSYDRQLMDAIKSTGAQREVDLMRKRFTYGRIGRIKAGRMPGRSTPYGYAYAYNTAGVRSVVIVEEQAAVVREIIERYLAGSGANTILDDLNARGIVGPAGGIWHKTSVHNVLRRVHAYAGWSRSKVAGHGVIESRGAWEPIIDDLTAERVRIEHASRKANRRVADSKARFRGIVYCETCKRPMRQVLNPNNEILEYDKRRNKPRIRRAYFYCVPSHPGASISTHIIAEAIRAAIDVLAASDLSQLPDDDQDRAAALLAQIAASEGAIERHKAALRRADTAYVSGAMDDERYAEQVKRLRGAIQVEQANIDKLRAGVANEAAKGSRRERMADVIANGYKWLETDETAAANAWFRPRVQVWVADNAVTDVTFIT